MDDLTSLSLDKEAKRIEFGHSELIRNIGASLVIVVIFSAILSAYTLRQGAINEWVRQLESLALLLTNQIEQTVETGKFTLDLISKDQEGKFIQNDEFILKNNGIGLSESKSTKTFINVDPSIKLMLTINQHGALIKWGGTDPSLAKSIDIQEILRHHKFNTNSKVFLSSTPSTLTKQNSILFLSQRLIGPNREFNGVGIVGISIQSFINTLGLIISEQAKENTLSIGLYKENGNLITGGPKKTTQISAIDPENSIKNLKEKQFYWSIKSSEDELIEGAKNSNLIAVRRVNGIPLYVLIQAPEELYLSNWVINVRWIWITASTSLALVLIFEILLLAANRKTRQELIARVNAEKALKVANEELEEKVKIRTKELTDEIAARKLAQEELAHINTQIAEVSHRAGMAEMANSVLHNIGNVLNSINVSISAVKRVIQESAMPMLSQISRMLDSKGNELETFLTSDQKGSKVTDLLRLLSKQWESEHASISEETNYLKQSVEHIDQIINKQQSLSTQIGINESISVKKLIENILIFHQDKLNRSKIKTEVDVEDDLIWIGDKNKFTQILLNLLINAEESLTAHSNTNKIIKISAKLDLSNEFLDIEVMDNGMGIDPANLQNLFTYGFTTKPMGHGFGLHASALIAKDMQGFLKAFSDGMGHGAKFILRVKTNCS